MCRQIRHYSQLSFGYHPDTHLLRTCAIHLSLHAETFAPGYFHNSPVRPTTGHLDSTPFTAKRIVPNTNNGYERTTHRSRPRPASDTFDTVGSVVHIHQNWRYYHTSAHAYRGENAHCRIGPSALDDGAAHVHATRSGNVAALFRAGLAEQRRSFHAHSVGRAFSERRFGDNPEFGLTCHGISRNVAYHPP